MRAGVTRTERSIINWCRSNRQGVARLDAFFDENVGRYYITQQSVTRAIEEERAKQPAGGAAPVSEPEIPNRSESSSRRNADDSERVKELERQNRATTFDSADFGTSRINVMKVWGSIRVSERGPRPRGRGSS